MKREISSNEYSIHPHEKAEPYGSYNKQTYETVDKLNYKIFIYKLKHEWGEWSFLFVYDSNYNKSSSAIHVKSIVVHWIT